MSNSLLPRWIIPFRVENPGEIPGRMVDENSEDIFSEEKEL